MSKIFSEKTVPGSKGSLLNQSISPNDYIFNVNSTYPIDSVYVPFESPSDLNKISFSIDGFTCGKNANYFICNSLEGIVNSTSGLFTITEASPTPGFEYQFTSLDEKGNNNFFTENSRTRKFEQFKAYIPVMELVEINQPEPPVIPVNQPDLGLVPLVICGAYLFKNMLRK